MIYFPEPDIKKKKKVKVILDLPNYVTEKELN